MQPSENWGPTHKNIEKLQRRKSSRLAMAEQQQQSQQQSSSILEANPPLLLNGDLPQQTASMTNNNTDDNNKIQTNGNITLLPIKLRPKLKQTLSDPINIVNDNNKQSSSSNIKPLQQQNSFDNPSFDVQYPVIELGQPSSLQLSFTKSETNQTPRI